MAVTLADVAGHYDGGWRLWIIGDRFALQSGDVREEGEVTIDGDRVKLGDDLELRREDPKWRLLGRGRSGVLTKVGQDTDLHMLQWKPPEVSALVAEALGIDRTRILDVTGRRFFLAVYFTSDDGGLERADVFAWPTVKRHSSWAVKLKAKWHSGKTLDAALADATAFGVTHNVIVRNTVVHARRTLVFCDVYSPVPSKNWPEDEWTECVAVVERDGESYVVVELA